MADGPPGRRTLPGGISGAHEVPQLRPVRVGPATGDEFNTVTAGIIPVACWRVEDIRFDFGSSFVTPATRDELAELAELIKAHPGSPLSVFGHADPVGQDPGNKVLSGRRAMAIYALLIRDTAMWEELYSRPQGSDRWGPPALTTMHVTVNPPPAGSAGPAPETIAAIDRDPGQRRPLFAAYMDALCGQKLKLARTDFLARGVDADGKGDFQGCSEFNPVLIFSQRDQQRFDAAADKSERNAANAPNRRVMVLLFRKGSKVDPAKWPCPRAREGIAGCQRRFWSDGEARRTRRLADTARTFEESKDTFACRFYHRLTTGSPCETIPIRPTATIEIIRDQDRDRAVDERDPVVTFVRMGVWDNAYDPAGNVRNAAAENQNFVGDDVRRFYFRVRDPAAGGTVNITWKTLKSDKSDDDAPASQVLTLVETRAGSKVFVSRAVMLVTDDTDANQATDSGLAAPLPDVGLRNRGQSNHRLRRGSIDGFVKAEYAPPGTPKAEVERPIWNRDPDERRRVSVRVINYNTSATAAYIAAQFDRANRRWNQVGIQIDALATVNRPVPAAALDATGQYGGSANNANETAALNDLLLITPDTTVTAVFVPLSGANAYATIAQRTTVALADRYFIFINPNLNLENVTLAHELHHVLFNRFDSATARQFYTFNTSPPPAGTPLPDVRIRRRIHNQHAPDPDNDAANGNVLNWARRTRTARFPIADALGSAATATTGNTLHQAF